MNMKYAVLVVWDCDADRVIWRGDYVFCKFIQSDCCKIGDEKYVSGKYSIDEIQQLSKNRWIVKKVYGEICRFFQTWMKKNVCKFGISYQSNFQLTFSREFSDCLWVKDAHPYSMFWRRYLLSISCFGIYHPDDTVVSEWHPLFAHGKSVKSARLINHINFDGRKLRSAF